MLEGSHMEMSSSSSFHPRQSTTNQSFFEQSKSTKTRREACGSCVAKLVTGSLHFIQSFYSENKRIAEGSGLTEHSALMAWLALLTLRNVYNGINLSQSYIILQAVSTAIPSSLPKHLKTILYWGLSKIPFAFW